MSKKQIPCKNCSKLFDPKSEKNIFCSRRCFKKDYYHREKENDNNIGTIFICPKCKDETKLDFDVIAEYEKWNNFSCPKCGKKREM